MQDVIDRIRWPQVALLAIILTAAVTAIVLVPEEKWHVIPWQSIAAGVTLVGGAIAGLFTRPLLDCSKGAEVAARRQASTPPPPRNRESGCAELPLLYFVSAIGLALVGFGLLPGCGASALRQHATATAIAGIAVETAEDVYLEHLDRSEGMCSDEACIAEVREAHAPAEAAIGLARVAARTYADAVAIANEAEETDDLLTALITAALRLAARWQDVVAILAGLGVEGLPVLPLPGGAP
jgi:hypothetical protein